MKGKVGKGSEQTFVQTADGLRSSRGFIVRILDRYSLRYTNDNRSIVLSAEGNYIDGKVHLLIDIEQGKIQWESPHDKEPVTKEWKERLKDDLRTAYEHQGYIVEIDPELAQFGVGRDGKPIPE
jgi:hypothetical protein